MPALLTVASTMMCPHGGTVIATPGSARAQARSPILRASDTFVIVACAFNVSGAPNPCVSVRWVQTATRVKHSGDLVLNDASVGLCLSGAQAPQGIVLIAATQQEVAGL
jgi:hypothetical protein